MELDLDIHKPTITDEFQYKYWRSCGESDEEARLHIAYNKLTYDEKIKIVRFWNAEDVIQGEADSLILKYTQIKDEIMLKVFA